jgi:hypothetical protein
MTDDRAKARTKALFRDVNERIAESAERFDASTTEFVCECAATVRATVRRLNLRPESA